MAHWLYRFSANASYPDPLEEISALVQMSDAGQPVFLPLTAREHPPMSGAKEEDRVTLCTCQSGRVRKHASATVSEPPVLLSEVPHHLAALYADLPKRNSRLWVRLTSVVRGASEWIARSLRLFAGARQFVEIPVIETHPHGAFVMLARATGVGQLLPKRSREGRRQRLSVLRAMIGGLDDAALPNHDAVDAACAALVAALHVVGSTRPLGSEDSGGLIWMPDVSKLGPAPSHRVGNDRA